MVENVLVPIWFLIGWLLVWSNSSLPCSLCPGSAHSVCRLNHQSICSQESGPWTAPSESVCTDRQLDGANPVGCCFAVTFWFGRAVPPPWGVFSFPDFFVVAGHGPTDLLFWLYEWTASWYGLSPLSFSLHRGAAFPGRGESWVERTCL
jgi:hypothetical protein